MGMVLVSCWIMLFSLVSKFSRVLQQIPKPVVPLFWKLGKTKKDTIFFPTTASSSHHHHPQALDNLCVVSDEEEEEGRVVKD
jgi:hypothetical protein